MSLYSSPPDARSSRDDKPTLLVCWWCTLFAATVVMFRVTGRFIRSERLFREDKIALATLLPLFARMAFIHVVLIWGTNNAVTTGLTADEIYHREVGSRLVLAGRIFYAATLWMFKLAITEFFKRLTLNIWRRSYDVLLKSIRWFLLVTFIAVFISTLAECQPFPHYWQVVPDPGGSCRQGFVQLITMGACNVLTDFTLIAFPVPIILRSTMNVKRKVQLIALFSLSLAPIAVTLYRVPSIINWHGSQQKRSLWASIEILFASGAANALVLGSFVRDRGVKKVRWRAATSATDSLDRTVSIRGTAMRQWGSDEDLVRGLGLGADPELRGSDRSSIPSTSYSLNHASSNPEWHPHDATHPDLFKIASSPASQNVSTSRRVSFFDVGGLLDSDRRPSSTTQTTLDPSDGFATGPPTDRSRMDANMFLHDIGGLLGPKPRVSGGFGTGSSSEQVELRTIKPRGAAGPAHRSSAIAKLERGYEPPHPSFLEETTIPSMQLKDVGGLLH